MQGIYKRTQGPASNEGLAIEFGWEAFRHYFSNPDR